ncbi:MAG: CehA/McbA family metallohydrolase [Planctomycetaceae bacterium]|nr:CehA/McbA family metallohydrolase [Planctomycetaceae bacterium]
MLKALLPVALLASVLGLSLLAISQDGDDTSVEFAVLNEQNWDQFVPEGKEVDAIYGDIVLRNKHVVAVIAQPLASRNANMTVRQVGGCLIDFTTREHQSDQLSCFYPGQRDYPYSSWTAATATENSITIMPDQQRRSGHVSVTVRSEGNATRPTVETTYELGADDQVLKVSSRYSHSTGAPILVTLQDDMRIDGGKEDLAKSPNGTHDWYWAEDRYWGQAYGFRATGYKVQSNSDSRRGHLTYLGKGSQDMITLKAGGEFVLRRELACGRDRSQARGAYARTDGESVILVTLTIQDAAALPLADAELIVRDAEGVVSHSRADAQGLVAVQLRPGSYTAQVNVYGQQVLEQGEFVVTDETRMCAIQATAYSPGTLSVNVTDTANRRGLPCKVEIIGLDPTPTPDFGPETGEFAVRNLRYAPHGAFRLHLAPGRYQLIASHGPEYDAAFEEVEVIAEEATQFTTQLARHVETTGWISSDFHSHSSPSGDNTGSQLGRVLNLVCEHIEFAPCTEHNRITTYQPHIDSLDIAPFLSSVTGMELTGSPLPLNHQNVFPLHYHPHHQDGGGPQTDTDIEKQMQRLAAWDNGSEKLIQQNHPDVGWLVYDRDGNGEADGGYADSVALIDVMEIHPIETILRSGEADGINADEAKGNRIFKWLQLLNQGYRIPGVVNTDAHYNFHGSGWLRNWIACSTDDPAQIDPMEIVHASEDGRVVMSNGPFLKVSASAPGAKPVTAGQDLVAKDGKVTLDISVQCPNWHDVDTVFVLVNGRASESLTFTRDSHPQLFRTSGALRFEHQVAVPLDSDAHLVVATGGTNSTLGPVMGPSGGKMKPAALANPIYVDIDGNGFTANKDTLGRPLPVKGD